VKRIDILPDDVLLEIFDFCVITNTRVPYGGKASVEAWQSLVHVCQRWRSLVLESRHRLDLRLYCTPETPARDKLDVWPALPLIVAGHMLSSDTDNIIAALEQTNRVCQVDLSVPADRGLERVLAAMQVPFPELTDLRLGLHTDSRREVPVIPDSFLGGSAPRLRSFTLHGIPFPGLPKLLSSATHLVTLTLSDIPHSGYIPPKAMIALLSVLSSLDTLKLGFQSPQSRPDWESPSLPPLKRSILPALTGLHFKGVTKYLEELVIGIDTPQLDFLFTTFFNQIDFDNPRLAQFINCTPTLRAFDKAHVQFDDDFAHVELSASSPTRNLRIAISCREPDWQLSSIEQVCNSSLDPLSMVEDFYIEHRYSRPVWKNDAIENTLWLQFLLPFTAVKNLYLSKEFAPGIVSALQELIGGRITEILPSLQNIFVEGLEPSRPFQENIGRFVAARRLSGHPIAISDWVKHRPPVSRRAGRKPRLTSHQRFLLIARGQLRDPALGPSDNEDTEDDEDAEDDVVAPLTHWHPPAGPSNPITLSVTTQPGRKSDPVVAPFTLWHPPAGPSNPITLSVTTQPGSKSDPVVAPFTHWHPPAGPSNPTTLSVTTQPGSKSDPDRATEGTTTLGSSIGGSVDSSGSAAGALPEHGLGPERGPRPPRTKRWSRM
jgi:hypothetical protein